MWKRLSTSTSFWNSTSAVGDLRADGPAVLAVVALAPPAVQDAQVQPAAGREFHAARAAGLQRAERVVEPEIDPLIETAADVGVVILDEHDAVGEVGVACVLVNFLNDPLAALVLRVRLARENELHGPLGVVEQLEQPLRLAEKQAAALVRGEAAREADGQDFRVEESG